MAIGLQQGLNGRVFLTPLVEQRPTVGQFRSHRGARFQRFQLAASLVVGLNDRLAFAHPAGVQRAGVFEGLTQGGASARISRLRLVDRVPEGRAHLLEPRFEIAFEFGHVRCHGPRSDVAAGLRHVVPRAVQQGSKAGALQVQILRPAFDGLELANARLGCLVGQVRLAGFLQHIRGTPTFLHRRRGAFRLVRRLLTALHCGCIRPFGRFKGRALGVPRRQVGVGCLKFRRRLRLGGAGLFQCLLRRGQARQEFRLGGQPAFQVRGLDLQRVPRLGVVLGQRAQPLHGHLELRGAQDGVEARLT